METGILRDIALGFVCIALIVGLLMTYSAISKLEYKINILDRKIEDLHTNVSNIQEKIKDLDNKIKAIETTTEQDINRINKTLLSKIEANQRRIEELTRIVDNLTNTISIIGEDAEYVRSWLLSDARLDSSLLMEYAPELYYNLDKCEDDGYFHYRCLLFFLDNYIRYKNDSEVFPERGDVMLSPREMFEYNGGDCEDYAILGMALLNYLKDRGADGIYFWEEKPLHEYIFYEDEMYYYYLENAEKVKIPFAIFPNVYVMCYSNYDSGHCLNILCDCDIYDLANDSAYGNLTKHCIAFEPQTGEIYDISNFGFGQLMLKSGLDIEFVDFVDVLISPDDFCVRLSGDSRFVCVSKLVKLS